jgi:hypothetical protein
MTTDVTGYWTFFCAPKTWAIDDFLSTNIEYDTYRVNDWYKDFVQPGQLAVIRVGIDKRNKEQLGGKKKLTSGIYAIVEILDTPKMSTDVSDYYLNEEDQRQEKLRVKIRYLKNLLNTPLLLDTLKLNPITNQDQYLIDGFQRSTMPLRKVVFEEILNILGTDDQIFNNIESETADSIDEITKLELKYQKASPQVKEVISSRIERGKISSDIKKIYEYKCKVCEALGQNPLSFKKKNGKHYIETHHIFPVANLRKGSLGISNLITVCANHHRQFHYGNITIIENTNEKLIINIDGQTISTLKKKITSA